MSYESFLTSLLVSCVSFPTYLDGLKMGGRWPDSCRFVGCCFQELFNIARSILVKFPSCFFSIRVDVVHPYCRIDTIVGWKKLCFILSEKTDIRKIDNLSIAVHAFANRTLMPFSVHLYDMVTSLTFLYTGFTRDF